MTPNYSRTRFACYYSYLSMSSVFVLPAMLFVTFNSTFGISYTLLGTLVLINFTTQFCIDLVFTFFAKYFNPKIVVRVMPLLTSFGLFVYALLPNLFPKCAYLGLAIGTVLFSVSAGLSEVLLSPMVAAMPSEHPERDMSTLHSLYAWGVVCSVLISTIFLRIFGTENWMYLTMLLAILPIGASILFSISPIPDMSLTQNEGKKTAGRQGKGILLCFLCIFVGSASENLMTNWISDFMETGLSISKDICDILGIALFGAVLGSVRTLYARFGKNIVKTLFVSMIGATVCYLVAGLSGNVIAAGVACVLCGGFTSMLWPGTLIMMEENMPALGVTAYALMAAGGDFGGSIAPQLMGIITDVISKSEYAISLAEKNGMSPDQIGLKTGMVLGAIFPTVGIVMVLLAGHYFRKMNQK